MALLTIPVDPQKGEILPFSLDVSDLSALVSEAYYADANNWSRVIVLYKSFIDEQLIGLSFFPNNTDMLSSSTIIALTARNFFEVYAIIVYDQQNGHYIVNEEDIPFVNNYNLILPGNGASYFPFYSPAVAYSRMGQDADYLYMSQNSSTSYLSQVKANAVISTDTGAVIEDLTDVADQWATLCLKFNADKTKLYAIGRYKLSYGGQPLPAITVGANYTVNPPRLVEVDVLTGVPTWICDFQDIAGFADFVGDFIIDEDLGIVIVYSSGLLYAMGAYNFSNVKLWQFPTAANDPFNKIYSLDADYFLAYVSSYDATVFTQRTLTKIDKLTGALVPLAVQPNAPGGVVFATAPWSPSPDMAKVYISYYDGSNYSAIYDVASDTWDGGATISLAEGGNPMGAIAVTDSFVFFQKASASPTIHKYNRLLVEDPTFPLLSPGFVSPMYANDTDLYYKNNNVGTFLKKASSVTGVIDIAYLGFIGPDALITQTFDDALVIRSNAYFNAAQSVFTNPPAANTRVDTVSKVNKITREIEDLITPPVNSYEFRNDFDIAFQTSPLIPGKTLSVEFTSGDVYCLDTVTGLADTGWPLSLEYVTSYQIDGDYLYLSYFGDSTKFIDGTDNLGAFSLNTLLIRVNILTKTVDRSFAPAFPTAISSSGTFSLSPTSEYIYITTQSTPGEVVRVKKSDQAVQYISTTDIGCVGNFAGRIKVYELSANRIMMVADKFNYTIAPGFTFNDHPYILLTEDTLVPEVTQPTATNYFMLVTYNPTNNELAGVSRVRSAGGVTFGDVFLSSYGIAGAGTINLVVNISEDRRIAGNSFSPLNELTFIQSDGAGYFLYLFGPCLLSFQLYNGIIRMEPMGIVNNG